jgi:hypothetical protein
MNDRQKTPADEAMAELVALAQQDGLPDEVSGGANPPERVDCLMRLLSDGLLGEWPTSGDLRRLAPADNAAMVRQIGVFVERLSALRLELLDGRRPRLI